MNRMSLYTLGFASALAYGSAAVAQGTDNTTPAAAPAPAMAPAGMASKPLSYGVLGGATVPTGNLSDGAGTGWHLGAFVAANHDWPISVRLEGVYDRFGSKDFSGGTAGITVHDQPSLYSGRINGIWDFPVSGEIQPYIIAGVGLYHLSVDETCTAASGSSCNGVSLSASSTRFGLNGGAGINLHLSGFSTFVEARVHEIFTQGSSSQMIPISVGVRF